jgi:hypothetical protein
MVSDEEGQSQEEIISKFEEIILSNQTKSDQFVITIHHVTRRTIGLDRSVTRRISESFQANDLPDGTIEVERRPSARNSQIGSIRSVRLLSNNSS